VRTLVFLTGNADILCSLFTRRWQRLSERFVGKGPGINIRASFEMEMIK
jgi:hypothetical protein